MRVGLIVPIALVLAACVGSQPQAAGSGVASASPTPCSDIACSMTKPSGVNGLMLPRDATVHPGAVDLGWDTHLFGIVPLVGYYDQALTARGWLLVPKDSVMDPARVAPGYYYAHLYCRPGPAPVTIFLVTVGNIDGTDVSKAPTARQAEIIFTTPAPEGACP